MRRGELEPDLVVHVLRADVRDLLAAQRGELLRLRHGGEQLLDADLAATCSRPARRSPPRRRSCRRWRARRRWAARLLRAAAPGRRGTGTTARSRHQRTRRPRMTSACEQDDSPPDDCMRGSTRVIGRPAPATACRRRDTTTQVERRRESRRADRARPATETRCPRTAGSRSIPAA